MKVLMIDVGIAHLMVMASGHEGFHKVPSEPGLTAADMVIKVIEATKTWDYEAVTIGYPGVDLNGKPVQEPQDMGAGWVSFNYDKAFKVPVKFINEAAMHALASYEKGRMLFLNLDIHVGATIVVDDVLVPLEIGGLYLPNGKRFRSRLSNEYRKEHGLEKWESYVHAVVEMLRDVFAPDDIVFSGRNAKNIGTLPAKSRIADPQRAFLGATRLWKGADMLAEAFGSSWRITVRK